MVLTGLRPALARTVIVPDEQTWTLSGSDPAVRRMRPVFTPGEADRLLVPKRLPAPLKEALRSSLISLPGNVEVETRALPGLGGDRVSLSPLSQEPPDEAHHAAHGGHEHESHGHDHGSHGHGGDMMAIVGTASADGLVMEPIELSFGPLGTPLPGGLAIDVTLDGDVVAESKVRALLRSEAPPDLLAPVAWTLAFEAAAQDDPGAAPWRGLAALEVERAVSHLAWLRALARLLGWRLLIERCSLALEGLPPVAHRLADRRATRAEGIATELPLLEQASERAAELAALVRRSRWLRLRAADLGPLTAEQARELGLHGPVARASGLPDDLRAGDPVYERLSFEPVLHSGGDAYSRTLLRAEEARDSLALARAALVADAQGASSPERFPAPGQALEGPRGPLRAPSGADGGQPLAPGSEEALRSAGEAMVGAEWSAALVALASFDLSPWRVGW